MYFWLMWMKDNNSQDTLASLATWHANGKKKKANRKNWRENWEQNFSNRKCCKSDSNL